MSKALPALAATLVLAATARTENLKTIWTGLTSRRTTSLDSPCGWSTVSSRPTVMRSL
jgi:hypothetical protein